MAIANAGTVSGSGSGTSIVTGSWTPGSNELVLVAVALRNETITPSVSGNGLTFVSVADVDNVQGQNGINLFRAMGSSPTTGAITVTLTGNSTPVFVRAYRFSGVDTSGTNGSGAVEASATNTGPNPDDDDMLQAVTTVTDDAWAVAFGTYRAGVFTVPTGETALNINDTTGSGGDITTLSSWYEVTTTAGSYQLGALNDLNSARDWCMIVVSLKPAAGSSSVSGSAAGVATVSGSATGRTSLRASIAVKPSVTATITGWGYISGSAAGAATASGGLAMGLVGSAAGIATVSGVLSATVSIAGTADGAATVTAVLSATISIAGSAAGVATASGILFDANFVIIPSVPLGTAVTCLLADPFRNLVGQAHPEIGAISWRLNDFGMVKLKFSRNDPMAKEDYLRTGVWVYLMFGNGLPDWAGFIMDYPEPVWTYHDVTFTCYSAEGLLKRYQTDKGRYFSQATAGHIFRSVIGDANAAWGMDIAIGNVTDVGTLHSPDYHHKDLFWIVQNSICGSLEDFEFYVEPTLANGRIKLTAHLQEQRGGSKPDVVLIQGHNMINEKVMQSGPLVNHWQLAGADISGDAASGWGDGRLVDTTTGVDVASIAKYGRWMGSEVFNGVRSQGELSNMAQWLIQRTKQPRVMICCGAKDLAPARFADYDVGTAVRALAPVATFEPYDDMIRVVGREFNVNTGELDLALEAIL